MSKHPYQRKNFFVDPKVQGALIARIVLYWFVYLIGIALMTLCWQILTGPRQPFLAHLMRMWTNNAPVLVASLLLMPVVMVDLVRLSNRFVGPLFRLRRSMRELARGQHVEPLEFRDADFWQEVAGEFNAIAAHTHRPAVAQETEQEDDLVLAEVD